jgi:SsrA-binding protein
MKTNIEIKNKKAGFEYVLLDRYTAGIVLTGTEIKSIRQGKASFVDSFCILKEDRAFWIKGMHIAEYMQGSYNNHEPKRDRKLLLNAKEIKKISVKVKEKGFTVIPVRLFFNERGFAKIEIAVAKGKNTYDKRETLKKKDANREMERMSRR